MQFNSEYVWVIALGFGVSAVLVYWFSRGLFTLMSLRAAWGLVSLRIITVGLLVLSLNEPVSRVLREQQEPANLAVLVDVSASMGLTDLAGSRQEVLSDVLNSPAFDGLRANHQVSSFGFAEDLVPFSAGSDELLNAGGGATDMGNALGALQSRALSNRLSAAILISDGNFTTGRDPLHVAQDIGFPVYTVGIGDTVGIRDIGISSLTTNDITYSGSNVPVEVAISSQGFDSLRVLVTLHEEGRILDRYEVTLREEQDVQNVTFNVIPEKEGIHRYLVEVEEVDGEITASNNRRAFSIKTLKSKLRILYIEGAPRADIGFLWRTLQRDASFEVTSLVFRPDGSTFPEPIPTSESDWFAYDLIILGSVAQSRLQQWSPFIVAFVEDRGGSLIALGGPHSFEMGGYAGTEVGDMMPFQIDRSPRGMTTESFVLSLTLEGKTHPMTRLSENAADSERLWGKLPPLPGMNQAGKAKPGATVLATHPDQRIDGERSPVISFHRYGRGKVMAFAAHGAWRWDLMSWGSGSTNEVYERWWNNAVRWMTVQETSRRVRVASDRRRYRGGESIRFNGQAYDEHYRPLNRARMSVTVLSQEDSSTVAQLDLTNLAGSDGRYTGQLQFLPSGGYAYSAQVSMNELTLGTDLGSFEVGEAGKEFQQTRMNRRLLTQLAESTGAKFFHASEIKQLGDEASFDEVVFQASSNVAWWNHPGALILLIALLSAEWLIRRLYGTV